MHHFPQLLLPTLCTLIDLLEKLTRKYQDTSTSGRSKLILPAICYQDQWITHASSVHPLLSATIHTIVLPGLRDQRGEPMAYTPVAITRLLQPHIKHQYAVENNQPYFYIRSHEVIPILSACLYSNAATTTFNSNPNDGNAHSNDNENDKRQHPPNQKHVIAAAKILTKRGIFHNYTPNSDDWMQAYLVLQPLQEPRILNTYMIWPSKAKAEGNNGNSNNHHNTGSNAQTRKGKDMCEEGNWNEVNSSSTSTEIMLRLSKLMDSCMSGGNGGISDYQVNTTLFDELEIAVCQLQVTELPKTNDEKIAFVVNLFNLIVRHAMIVFEQRHWTWPTSLDEFHDFLEIGYNVGGNCMTLGSLLAALYGQPGIFRPKVTEQPQWTRLLSCVTDPFQYDEHYAQACISTDVRVLMALTWGCRSSPRVTTLYPHRLEEGLQRAAEVYCQRNVQVDSSMVILPKLLTWYRKDFGDNGNQVSILSTLQPYLSSAQRLQIESLRNRNRLVIIHEVHYNWTKAIATQANTVATQSFAKSKSLSWFQQFLLQKSAYRQRSRAYYASTVDGECTGTHGHNDDHQSVGSGDLHTVLTQGTLYALTMKQCDTDSLALTFCTDMKGK
jgi:hypothetical protein